MYFVYLTIANPQLLSTPAPLFFSVPLDLSAFGRLDHPPPPLRIQEWLITNNRSPISDDRGLYSKRRFIRGSTRVWTSRLLTGF